MHYYKRNIGDYAKKTGRLTMLQHGAYNLLIDSCYDREKFPTLDEAIDWTWASTEAEVEAVKFVLSRFFKLNQDGRYVQDRIADELAQYHKNAGTNKQIAAEREAKRRQNATNRDEDSTNRVRIVNEPPPNHKPLTTNQETINQEPRIKTKNSPASVTDSRFDEIRFAYPKRGGSNRWPEAEKAYKKRLSENHTHEQILDGVKRYANFINLTGRLGTEYVMMASRFLGPNKEFTEAWQPPAEPKAPKILSAAERVQLAMRGEKHERVVSEQRGSGFASLDVLVRDVWK